MERMERLEGRDIGVPKGRLTRVLMPLDAPGSGVKRPHHFSICGDRASLLLRRGQRAEGGNTVQA